MATDGEKERAIRATIYWAASEVICLFLFFFFLGWLLLVLLYFRHSGIPWQLRLFREKPAPSLVFPADTMRPLAQLGLALEGEDRFLFSGHLGGTGLSALCKEAYILRLGHDSPSHTNNCFIISCVMCSPNDPFLCHYSVICLFL